MIKVRGLQNKLVVHAATATAKEKKEELMMMNKERAKPSLLCVLLQPTTTYINRENMETAYTTFASKFLCSVL